VAPTETVTPSSAPTVQTSLSPTTTDENRGDKNNTYIVPHDVLLVSNTRGDEAIVQFDLMTQLFTPFIPTSAGLFNPDHMIYDPVTGDLYISHGDTEDTSAIAKVSGDTGLLDPLFAAGGGLTRPYGFAMEANTGILYVASFRTDQILMYNSTTGEYLDVFAAGNATNEGFCNGPNHMVIYNGTTLYVTTQGTYIEFGDDDAEDDVLQFGLASQVIQYDLRSGKGIVFATQPALLNVSQGYVSLLGLSIQCQDDDEEDCTLFTTDFGVGLRAYDLDSGELKYASETTYEDDVGKSSTGALAYVPMTDSFYIPSFINETYGAALLAFNATTVSPTTNALQAIVSQDNVYLSRPIGIIYIPHVDATEVESEEEFSSTSDESSGDGTSSSSSSPLPEESERNGTTAGSTASSSSGSVLYQQRSITLLLSSGMAASSVMMMTTMMMMMMMLLL
jgi:hypothetical protein